MQAVLLVHLKIFGFHDFRELFLFHSKGFVQTTYPIALSGPLILRTNSVSWSTSPCGIFSTLVGGPGAASPRSADSSEFLLRIQHLQQEGFVLRLQEIKVSKPLCNFRAISREKCNFRFLFLVLRISYPFPWACAMWQMAFGWLIFVPLWTARNWKPGNRTKPHKTENSHSDS